MKYTMAADPTFIQKWVERNGPYLYHGAHPRNGEDPEQVAQTILAEGLQPSRGRVQPEYPGSSEIMHCENCGYVNNVKQLDENGEDCLNCGKWLPLEPALEEWWHHPRPNHVFMVADPEMAYGQPLFRIDLRKLDPHKLKADDDYLRDYYPDKIQFHKWTEPTPENPPRTLGEQAEAIGWGDNPDNTHGSLETHGVIAHEGPIPPEAIERIRS